MGEDKAEVSLNATGYTGIAAYLKKNTDITRVNFPKPIGDYKHVAVPDEMPGLFEDCTHLERVDLSGLSLKGCTDPSRMFKGCDHITQLTNLNDMQIEVGSGKEVNFESMFEGCKNLKYLKFDENFDTSCVTNMRAMFKDCHSLLMLNFPMSFKTSNVKTMESMFDGCVSLCNISFGTKNDEDSSGGFNTENVTNMHAMFKNCRHIGRTHTIGGGGNAGKSLQTFTLSKNFTVENCTDLSEMFYCDDSTAIEYDKHGDDSVSGKLKHTSWLKQIVKWDGSAFEFNAPKATTTKDMFRGLESLGGHTENHQAGKLPIVKTSDQLTDCSGMFDGCYNMGHVYPVGDKKKSDSLDVTGINLSNVTDTSRMFKGCYYLQDAVGTLNFVGPKVTNANEMFSGCSWMKTIDLQNFNPDNLQSMDEMFADLVDASIIKLNKLNNGSASKKDVFKHIPHERPDPDKPGQMVMVTTYFTGQITLGPDYKFADNATQDDVPYEKNMPVLYSDDPVPDHPTITVNEISPVQALNGFNNDLAHRVDLKEEGEKNKVHTWLLAQTIEVVDDPSIQVGYLKRVQFKQGDGTVAKLENNNAKVNTDLIKDDLEKIQPQHKNIKIRGWNQYFGYSQYYPKSNNFFYQLVPKYSACVQFKDPLASGSQLLTEFHIPYETDNMQYSFIAAGFSPTEPSPKPGKKFIGYKLVGSGDDKLYQPSDFNSYTTNNPPLIKYYVKPDEGPSEMVFEAQYKDEETPIPPATALDSGNSAIGGMLASSIVLGLAGVATGKKYFSRK